AWRNLGPDTAVWKDNGDTWSAYIPSNSAKWHYGPARLWTTPVNSDHYEITSRVFTSSTMNGDCGHIFKYKMGSIRSKSLVTKAWGYFLWARAYMYITTNGKESSPRINYKYKTNQWYNLKTVVNGTLVKIYIDNKLVKQVTMVGAGATSKTDNYVGLWCHGKTNDKGKNFKVKILSGNNQIKCASNHIQIAIPKSSLPFVRAKDLRLNQPPCRATEDSKNFYLQTAFDKCGTTTTKTGSTITYSNKVLGRPLANKTVISRIRDVGITFSCSYPRTTLLRSSTLQPNNSKYVFTFHSQGKFNFSLQLFPTDQFKNPYTKYPVSFHLRQLVYVEVAVKSVKKELSVLAQQCYATPASNGAAPKHWLIKDSCPVDPTLKNLTSPNKNVQRFSVQAFRFVGNHQHVYFHCHVIACNGNGANNLCARGCSKKGIGKRNNEDNSIKLIEGPIAVRGQEIEDPELHGSQGMSFIPYYNPVGRPYPN
ncbi:hypothetical protein QZH41_020467, partial [Actinostola sp. cb2023]